MSCVNYLCHGWLGDPTWGDSTFVDPTWKVSAFPSSPGEEEWLGCTGLGFVCAIQQSLYFQNNAF